ncbi:MAG: hypothetical protein KGZ42_02570 [Melioribacter sp.]|nr:hypothetical protein [Melioribacter sp.]
MKIDKQFIIKKALPVLGGALLGYAYYYFIGCYSGTCPITSNPYISTFYGALIAFILVLPTKKKSEQLEENK